MHHAGGVGGEPPVLQQQHHGGVKQNGGLVEDVLQGHQAHAGAKRQAAAVEVVGLHRHGTGTQADDVAEGAHERRFQRLPHGETGHPAADDDPADQTFQHRVGQAHGQHEQHLPEAQLCQRGRDLGPVALEDPEDDAGEHRQNGEREDRFFAGRLLRGGLVHQRRLLSKSLVAVYHSSRSGL